MSMGIIDNHSGNHGDWVTQAAREHFDGEIAKFDLGLSVVPIGFINDEFEKTLPRDLGVINLSFGALEVTNDDSLLSRGANSAEYYEVTRENWLDGSFITVAAGNAGSHTINNLASSPYTFGISAAVEGQLADFSQYHERFTFGITDDRLEVGDTVHRGTSFSSPRVGAALADAKERLDLTNPETITAFQQTADTVTVDAPGLRASDSFTALRLDAEALQQLDGPIEGDADALIDAGYRILLGVQPPDAQSGRVADRVRSGETTVKKAANNAATDESIAYNNDDVPMIQRVQATFQFALHREPSTEELTFATDTVMNAINKDAPGGVEDWEGDSWQDFVEGFVNFFEDKGEAIYHRDALEQFMSADEQQFIDQPVSTQPADTIALGG